MLKNLYTSKILYHREFKITSKIHPNVDFIAKHAFVICFQAAQVIMHMKKKNAFFL